MSCDCEDCEAMMQPYLDGMLSDEDLAEALEHLEACPGCEKRYRFEQSLRHFVRIAAGETMSDDLRERLAGLRQAPPPAS